MLLEMKNKGKKGWQSSVLDLFKEKKYYEQSSVLFVLHFVVFCERKTQRQIKKILGSPEVQFLRWIKRAKERKYSLSARGTQLLAPL